MNDVMPGSDGLKSGDFEKGVSCDLTLSEASPAGGYRIRSAFVGSESRDLTLGRAVHQGVGCERCRNSRHSKNCVSLSSCRKTKLKKLINVSYLNYGES